MIRWQSWQVWLGASGDSAVRAGPLRTGAVPAPDEAHGRGARHRDLGLL